jgi:starch phosphorylase
MSLELMNNHRQVAYFSMEVAIDSDMPTYAGGLGVLAGDTIRSAADLAVPLVAVTLLHRKGYFNQELDEQGWQHELPMTWDVTQWLDDTGARACVMIEDRPVQIRAWKRHVVGATRSVVPVYFLDTDLAENSTFDRSITDLLYGGDAYYRLCQEIVLGIGGVRILRALGHREIERFHLNEGHSSLLTLELLEEHRRQHERGHLTEDDIEAVREMCVFTTHTPVAAGHDQFPLSVVKRVLGDREEFRRRDVFCCEGMLNMTFLALNMSHYVNGVAKKHGELAQHLYAQYRVDSITNGVHAASWVSEPFAALFDQYIRGWREDNYSLRNALGIPRGEIWKAHRQCKARLLEHVQAITNVNLDPDALTIGFARRMTTYKRADLLLYVLDRLKNIAQRAGRLQVIFAGKAHPLDIPGKEMLQRVVRRGCQLPTELQIVFLPDYDLKLARIMTAGCDVWLNTPQPPLEASGTSGMKAALNGVPSLSVLDGWWIEGCIEGITGWAIGSNGRNLSDPDNPVGDAASLYSKLEIDVLPRFYGERDRFVDMMSHSIALNGSFFNTQRMVQQYVMKAYFR